MKKRMNLTLSIDAELLARAREVAERMGTSVNQLVRDYLEQMSRLDDVEGDLGRLRELSGSGRSAGWTFDREEIHERR